MAPTSKIDRGVMREHNRTVVLDLVRRSGPLARSDVARRTSLAKPTVTTIVEGLIDDGLLFEMGTASNTGGRPSTLLDFNARNDAYFGIHVGVDTTTVAVADGRGDIVARRSRPSAVSDPRKSVEHVRRLASAALTDAQLAADAVRHATVVVPGLVDRATGVCKLAPNLGWRDVDVVTRFGRSLGVPVSAWNSTQASALAESRHGAATGVRTFVWIYVGSGVGSAIVHDGQLIPGARGFAGEIGHCRVVDDGPRCHCGKHGCLEVFTSARAISDQAGRAGVLRAGTHRSLAVDEIIAAAHAGDRSAIRVFDDAGHLLGLGASYLVSILNPELVVVGGEAAAAGDLLLEPMRATLHADVLEPEQVKVVASTVSGDAAVEGAVLLSFDAGVHAARGICVTSDLSGRRLDDELRRTAAVRYSSEEPSAKASGRRRVGSSCSWRRTWSLREARRLLISAGSSHSCTSPGRGASPKPV